MHCIQFIKPLYRLEMYEAEECGEKDRHQWAPLSIAGHAEISTVSNSILRIYEVVGYTSMFVALLIGIFGLSKTGAN